MIDVETYAAAKAYTDAHGGGGSGEGDMKKSVYDSDLAVAGAGGIGAFVGDAVSNSEKDIYAVMGEMGAKNIANNDATTKTDSGVLFTVNADKSVTIQRQSPTTDPYSYIKLFDDKTLLATPLILSGCPNITGLTLYLYDKTTSTRYNQTGDEIEVTPVAGHTYSLVIEALNSADLDTAVTVYPMIRDARITDPTYVPYAMTNRELTERFVYKDYSFAGITIDAKSYSFIDIDDIVGYIPFATNTLYSSLSVFTQCCKFGNVNRISIYNALDQAITYDNDSFVRVWYIKL